MERRFAALRMFMGERCLCGREKLPRRGFCGLCFRLLPSEMKDALAAPLDGTYEAAWIDAADWLTEWGG
jgi:hypothetical protein